MVSKLRRASTCDARGAGISGCIEGFFEAALGVQASVRMVDHAAALGTKLTARSLENSALNERSGRVKDLPKRPRRSKPPLWDRRDRGLTPKQRADKANFLGALSLARRGKERFDHALVRLQIDVNQVLKTTNAVKIRNGKLIPKVRDEIPRQLRFYEKGKLRHAEVANSAVASDIGRYWNAIGQLTETGKTTGLRRLRRRRFKDIEGHYHALQKDPKIILELEAKKPKPEMFEIYKR